VDSGAPAVPSVTVVRAAGPDIVPRPIPK
jgi:hypothetical protein